MLGEVLPIVEVMQGIGFIGLLVILAIPKLKNTVFGMNGNGKELKEIRDNHLHDITGKLDELIQEERRGNEISKESLIQIREARKDIDKIK